MCDLIMKLSSIIFLILVLSTNYSISSISINGTAQMQTNMLISTSWDNTVSCSCIIFVFIS